LNSPATTYIWRIRLRFPLADTPSVPTPTVTPASAVPSHQLDLAVPDRHGVRDHEVRAEAPALLDPLHRPSAVAALGDLRLLEVRGEVIGRPHTEPL
jgi:hypothetical protein